MLTLFGLTAVLLLAPKALSLRRDRACGARRGVTAASRGCCAAACSSSCYSMLLAPVRMLFHSQFVFAALTGWRLDWKSPPRDGDCDAVARGGARGTAWHTLLALAWLGGDGASAARLPVVAVADHRRACC